MTQPERFARNPYAMGSDAMTGPAGDRGLDSAGSPVDADEEPTTPGTPPRVADGTGARRIDGLADDARGDEPDRQAALRALRSLEATEARLERNAKREAEDARGRLVQDLLPVLDNLDRTIRASNAGRGDPAMLEGVRMVRHQLEGVLRGYGVERIDATGVRFDPGLHEAIGVTPVNDPQRHGLVLHQLEPGYRFGDRLLRPARVNVGKLIAPADTVPRSIWR